MMTSYCRRLSLWCDRSKALSPFSLCLYWFIVYVWYEMLSACLYTLLVTVSLVSFVAIGFEQRRCIRCRSRGQLGDCRDPFFDTANLSAIVENSRQNGIAVEPCASGWCGKFIEEGNGFNDFDIATERMCMPRPPSDYKQRCAVTKYGHGRSIFLCMCKGDLCNGGASLASRVPILLTAILLSLLVWRLV